MRKKLLNFESQAQLEVNGVENIEFNFTIEVRLES